MAIMTHTQTQLAVGAASQLFTDPAVVNTEIEDSRGM